MTYALHPVSSFLFHRTSCHLYPGLVPALPLKKPTGGHPTWLLSSNSTAWFDPIITLLDYSCLLARGSVSLIVIEVRIPLDYLFFFFLPLFLLSSTGQLLSCDSVVRRGVMLNTDHSCLMLFSLSGLLGMNLFQTFLVSCFHLVFTQPVFI